MSTRRTCFPAFARCSTTSRTALLKVSMRASVGAYPEGTICATRTAASGQALVTWSIKLPSRSGAVSGSKGAFISLVPAWRSTRFGLSVRESCV